MSAAPHYRTEVRRNPDGSVDEVLLWDADRCLFHLEQLGCDRFWFALYPDDPTSTASAGDHFDIFLRKRSVVVAGPR